MKFLNIIFHDIKCFVNSEKRIFFILFFGLFISSFSLIFLFLFTINTKNRLLSYDEYKTRQYNIDLRNMNITQKYDLLNQVDSLNDMPDMDQVFLSYDYIEEGHTYYVNGFYTIRDPYYITQGEHLNSISKNSQDKIAIISNDLLDYSKKLSYIGEEYILQKENYQIVGVCEMCPPRSIFIPYKTFLNSKYDIDAISIIYSKKLSSFEEINLEKTVKSTEMSIVIQKPLYDVTNVSAHNIKLFVYILLIASSIFTTMSMINYWIMKNTRQYVIYMLCGAKRIDIYLIMLIETLLISLFAYFVGFILFRITSPYISIYNIDISYGIKQIAYIFLIYFSLILFSVQPTAIKFTRKLSIYSLL